MKIINPFLIKKWFVGYLNHIALKNDMLIRHRTHRLLHGGEFKFNAYKPLASDRIYTDLWDLVRKEDEL